MSKIIIVKKNDGGVAKVIPNHNKYGDDKITYSECKGLKPYIEQGLEWFLCDNDDLPSKEGLESRKQLYHDGNSVKVDTDWSIRLMPDQLIKKKYLKKLSEKIDAELDSNVQDPINVIKLQRQYEVCKSKKAGIHNEDCFWTELALDSLDSRVTGGESDKPKIREKLNAKIQELKNATKK